ncbi:MAG: ribosome silencing factor [Verrucomicrobiota bacterium]
MPTQSKTDTTLDVLKQLVRAIDDKKAESLAVLDVSAKSSITDYLVLANGNSEPHLRALRIEAEKVLDAAGVPIAGMESGGYGSGWTVVDAYQIMLHLFTTEKRENYALDKLWKDAVVVDIKKLLAEPKKAAAKKPAAKKTAVKKTAAKKTVAKKAAGKKAPVKKVAVKAPVAKKAAAKKAVVKKPAVKKTAPKQKKTG